MYRLRELPYLKTPGWLLAIPAFFFLVGCAAFQSPGERAHQLAESAGLRPIPLPDIPLRSYARTSSGNHHRLTIFIESDGAPWPSRNEPPSDPTPVKPVVMRMAIAEPASAVAYLGRPCQYLEADALSRCNPENWINGRYGEKPIAVMAEAIDRLKISTGASEINLVGYSGGGVMAALIAARRGDVRCLVTVASPLDTVAWTQAMSFSPLDRSLNPVDAAHVLANIRQVHFRGGKDRLVPPSTTKGFFDRTPHAIVIDKADFDHNCCWDDQWRELRRSTCLDA